MLRIRILTSLLFAMFLTFSRNNISRCLRERTLSLLIRAAVRATRSATTINHTALWTITTVRLVLMLRYSWFLIILFETLTCRLLLLELLERYLMMMMVDRWIIPSTVVIESLWWSGIFFNISLSFFLIFVFNWIIIGQLELLCLELLLRIIVHPLSLIEPVVILICVGNIIEDSRVLVALIMNFFFLLFVHFQIISNS